jgi:hypothetical protein
MVIIWYASIIFCNPLQSIDEFCYLFLINIDDPYQLDIDSRDVGLVISTINSLATLE